MSISLIRITIIGRSMRYSRKIKIFTVFLCFFILFQTKYILANSISTTPSGIPITELEAQIDAFSQSQVGKTTPGMAVVVVKDGEIIFLKGYGYQDIENKIPVDPKNTVFEFGSITKLLVWTSVMQLTEKGDLDLNEDIKNYLPKDFTDQLIYEYPITMLDLMHHTAGFEQQPFDWDPLSPEAAIAPLELTLLEHQPKQIFKPKEVIAYSNYGASLAGFVVEQISGQKFYDYVSEKIFIPAGINNTTVNPLFMDNKQLIDKKAQGYMTTGNGKFKKGIWSFLWQYPAGAANGTIEDLGKYLIALTPNAPKSMHLFKNENTLTDMFTHSYSPNQTMSSNAHGFWEQYGNGVSYWHPGNTASFSSFLAIDPKERFGIAVLTNASYAFEPTYGLGRLLLGEQTVSKEKANRGAYPSAYDLNGRYIYSIYSDEGYYKSASYLGSLVNINVIDENTINVSSAGKNSTYTQVSPYYYKLMEANSTDLFYTQPQLYVEVDNNKIKRISSGHMTDIIPIPDKQPLWFFSVSVGLYIIASVFFTILLCSMIIIWFRKRKAHEDPNFKHQNYFLTAYAILGVALAVNNAFILLPIPLQAITVLPSLNPFLFVNGFIIFIFIVLFFYRLIVFSNIDFTLKQRTANYVTAAFFTVFTIVLYNWKLLAALG